MVWKRGCVTKLVDSKSGNLKVFVQCRPADADDNVELAEIECEIFQVQVNLQTSTYSNLFCHCLRIQRQRRCVCQVRFLHEKDAHVHVRVGMHYNRAGDPVFRKALVSLVHPDGRCDVEYESSDGKQVWRDASIVPSLPLPLCLHGLSCLSHPHYH